ncbi:S27A2-like protein [Mya arenaria]|uniref:Long-chain-fatty-acid--CoA ligase n=1 Tax=Mya arenaria TaxID=6604 RepID=A0ABY7DUA1_MYAAR|nr:long-chain fatty acid transport protein 2-like [Mya arenaria]WAR00669.1 S27A2-like protein [Mya arenaria]
MLAVLVGSLGVSGALYLLLRLFWPGWYLDWIYRRNSLRLGAVLMGYLEQEKYLIDIFEEQVKRGPKKALIIFQDRKYSYEYFDQKSSQAGRAGIEIGLKPGSTVAIMIYNEPEFVWTYLGFMKVGYQTACINYNLRSKSLAHSINASGANVLILGQGPELHQAIQEILPDISGVTVYIQGPLSEPKPVTFLSFDLVMNNLSDAPIDRSIRKHITPFSTNVLIYTSGTTGLPKPAIRDHQSCVKSALSGRQRCQMVAGDVLYEVLPLYHSSALIVGFGTVLSSGATMVLRDKFSAKHFWEDCRKYDVTVIQYIGEVCRYLVAQPKNKLDGQHKVRVAVGNGLRQDIWTEFQSRFNIPRIIEFYGATENPSGFVNLTNKEGACGRASPYLRQFSPVAFVKWDIEAQAPFRNRQGFCVPVGPDAVGLLIVPISEERFSFQGYRGPKEDTEKKILRDVFEKGDQYFNSGDLMRIDKEYYLYFNDRVGDTFRWKGENVSTTEVSNILTSLDFIHDANVYGVAIPGTDGRAGMVSFHMTDEGATSLSPTMLTQISRHVNKMLPGYARPRFLRVQPQLQLTSTFKQLKAILVREGFDPIQVRDPLYFLDPATQAYRPLDNTAYTQIMAGNVPL